MTPIYTIAPRQSKLGAAVAAILCAFLLVVVGASVALFGIFGAAFWLALIAAALMLVFLAFFPLTGRDLLFFAALAGLICLPIVHKVLGIAGYGFWQVFVFASALLGLPKLLGMISRSKLLIGASICFLLFLFLVLLSTYLGRSRPAAAIYQFLSDLKPFLLLAFGLAIVWRAPAEKTFWFVVRWFWLWELAFVVFGWVAPGVYEKVFPEPGSYWKDPSGIFPGRALGPFVHPSILASISAFFGLVCLIKSALESEQRFKFRLLAVAYFALVFFAVQRQEIVSFILAAAFVIVIVRPEQMRSRILLAMLLLGIGAVFLWVAFSEFILRDATTWGFNSTGRWDNPRALLYYGGFVLAKLYFPIGAGLGTYGGAGAMKFDLSVYDELGFRQYWWFQDEQFLIDTYWPNSLAESGFFGAALLLMFYCLVLLYAVIRSVKSKSRARLYWIVFVASTVYMLLVTFSSPAFQDTTLYFLPALMFGVAAKIEQQEGAVQAKATGRRLRPFALDGKRHGAKLLGQSY
ncbi:MAG: hypothetical protein GEV05_12495 [Betaproteobacteria bacterium]|nr:hypothetical protein [Betaproteobacteria bacterium]